MGDHAEGEEGEGRRRKIALRFDKRERGNVSASQGNDY